jgi:glycosyltransferase involved in cell wall biosynthesis
VRPLIVDLGREYRGGQNQALLLLQGLRARGQAPELIALRGSELGNRAEHAGVSVCAVGPSHRRLAAMFQIRRILRFRRADIVHANEPHALTSAWLARAHRSVPLVVSRRIAHPLSSSGLSLARYRAASRIVAVSRFVQTSVFLSGFPKDRVNVIHDGVQIPPELSPADAGLARAQFAISPEAFCVGNVAAFVPEKGHAILLRAFAEIRAQFPRCILLLLGEGPEKPAVQELAKELAIFEAVKFLAPATDNQTMFAAMDMFAFPSHEEPLGSALLAAMANGLPVLAVGRGGIPEVIETGKNGLLVDFPDPSAFADAIARLLTNREEAMRLGKTARETVIAGFSANQMVEGTLRLFDELIAAGR